MLIAHIEPPSPFLQGDQGYRTVQPCRALAGLDATEVISGTWLSPIMQQAAAQADVLVLCQAVDADYLPLMQKRRAAGLRTLFEINDNFMAPLSGSEVARFYAQPAQRSLVLQLASLADGLQLCTGVLAQRFGHLQPQHAVMPNHVWQVPPELPRADAGPVTVGWGGSRGHHNDILWIMPVLQQLMASVPHMRLSIMAPAMLHELFAWAPADRLILRPMADLNAYHSFLASLDIGLAPLLPTEFNACRSDVKYLEYASHGVASVCSDAAPYQSTHAPERGWLFADLPDLRAKLTTLLGDGPKRRAMGRAAWTYAHTRREADHAAARRAFAHGDAATPTARNQGPSLNALLTRGVIPHARPEPGYVQLRFGALEAHLYNGLLAGRDGLSDLHEAQRLAPDFYLPWLYMGVCQPDAKAACTALSRATSLNPGSVAAQHHLGDRAWEALEPDKAMQAWRRAVALAPRYAPSHEALGKASLSRGESDAAQKHLQAALQANAFYRVPAARLAALALERNDIDTAEHLLTETVRLQADAWLEHFLLGDVHRRRADWPNACRHLEAALAECPHTAPVKPMLAQVYMAQGKLHAAQQLLGSRSSPRG